jgi:hypothetical protein
VHAALLHSHSWHASDNKNKLSTAPSDKTFPPTLLVAGVVLLTIKYKLVPQICYEMFFFSQPKNTEEDKPHCMSNKLELLIQLVHCEG